MNKGDAFTVHINARVNGADISPGEYDDIELQILEERSFRSLKFLLSDNTLYYDDVEEKYAFDLSQEQTFKLPDVVKYQLRLLKDNVVFSSGIQEFNIGDVLSRKVLGDENS